MFCSCVTDSLPSSISWTCGTFILRFFSDILLCEVNRAKPSIYVAANSLPGCSFPVTISSEVIMTSLWVLFDLRAIEESSQVDLLFVLAVTLLLAEYLCPQEIDKLKS